MLITDLEIQAAKDQAEAAERELAEAEAPLMRTGRKVDEETAARLGMLTVQARASRANVDELVATRAEQRRQLQARAEREEKAAPAIGTAVKELDESRRQLVAAIAAGNLPAAGRAALAHDALVVAIRELLTGAQLRLSDVAEDVEHATGADASPTGGVRLRGRWWGRVDAATVLSWMTWRTARHILGQRVADRLVAGTVRHVEHRSDGLLDGVPDLPARAETPRWRPPSPPRDNMVVGRGKTYLERVAEERKPTPTPGWEARFRAEFGRDPEPAA